MVRRETAVPDFAPNFRSPLLQEDGNLSPLESGILQAVSYADIFDFPLTAGEIQHRLAGTAAPAAAVHLALAASRLLAHTLSYHEGYYLLRGREEIVQTRRQRFLANAGLWSQARVYGRLLSRIPFVRMVAVTGALAANNACPGDDIDFLIITAPGRLWLCRAGAILLVKGAARRGDVICPNYFLTTAALALPEHDLFTAHELLQMEPLYGFEVYKQMLALNSWAAHFLPNAFAAQSARKFQSEKDFSAKRILEKALSAPPGAWLESWEMKRKMARFSRQMAAQEHEPDSNGNKTDLVEVLFSAERCKGHFNRHGRRTLDAYAKLMIELHNQAAAPAARPFFALKRRHLEADFPGKDQ